MPEVVTEALAPDTYERLQQVKAKYDPDDVFRSSHPIPCAAAAA